MKKKNKIKFLEEQDKYFDSDCPTKSILAKRVDEIGLGYEQVKVEPEVLLPDTNYLGVPDKFAAYKNETDGSEYIASPSLSANKEEVSAFYLGGTFVANTCETMLTVDPREVLEEPESVEETVAELDLSIMIEDLSESCIIPLEEVDGWGDTNVEDWDKPVDENGEEIVGEWVVMNGGVVYDGKKKTASLVIKFIPENREEYKEITIDLSPEVSDEPPPDLLTKLSNHVNFEKIGFGTNGAWYNDKTGRDNAFTNRGDSSVGYPTQENNGIIDKCVYMNSRSKWVRGGEFKLIEPKPPYNCFFNSDLSVSFWVKMGQYSDSGSVINPILRLPMIKWGTKTYWYNLVIGTSIDLKHILVGTEDATIPYESSDELNIDLLNNWVFIVMTYEVETKNVIVYVNNKKVLEFADMVTCYPSNGEIQIGGGFNTNNGFVGYFDELAIWENKILTNKEMNMLYNNGAGLAYEYYV